MGENRASGEGILGGFVGEGVRCNEDDYPSFVQNTVRLYSFYSDKFNACIEGLLDITKVNLTLTSRQV